MHLSMICPWGEVIKITSLGNLTEHFDTRSLGWNSRRNYMSRLMTKLTKWSVRPAKTQISLGIRPVCSEPSLCIQWVAKNPTFLHVDSEDWSDWADAQADLSLRWAHSHFVGFVMRWLICDSWVILPPFISPAHHTGICCVTGWVQTTLNYLAWRPWLTSAVGEYRSSL